jgi:DNA ligase (NAD+)
MQAAHQIGSDARLELGTILGVGEAIAEELVAFFAEPHNLGLLHDLTSLLQITKASQTGQARETQVTGKIVVFTGSLQTMTRQEARATAEALGAKVSDSVSKKTDYVVVGADAGSKAKKAAELGVATLSEQEWRALIE